MILLVYTNEHRDLSFSQIASTMEEKLQFDSITILAALLFPILLWFIYRIFFLKPSTKKKLPPSPPKLPIIGNLHQLSSLPHHELRSMARKHGPIMLLHFGSVPVLIVSSAELARQVTKTHDLVFADRPMYKASKKLLYGCKDVGSAPYGEYWRRMKSIFVLQMLSNKRVQSFRTIREEEVALLVKEVEECCGRPLNLSEMFAKVNFDEIFRSSFGVRFGESDNGKKFLRVIRDFMELLGVISISDFVPWLGLIDRVNGFDKKLDRTAEEIDGVLEDLIEERQRKDVKEKNGDHFVDVLLEIYEDKSVDTSIDRDSMKALLMDLFVGGTDTISTTLEWTMSELLRNPTIMEKLQKEVRGIVKRKHDAVTDEDLEKMQYLKAVMKEAMRFHPPFPLLAPRISTKDVQIKGFDVAAGTWVMINAFAIGRDPISWDEPEKFMPERFLNSSIDFKGQDFELIPFGAGRRGCPGIAYAAAAMEFVLANLVLKFDWTLANGVEAKDLDMKESPGIAVHRAVPLLAIALR